MPVVFQGRGNGAADVTGSAGDQDFHRSLLKVLSAGSSASAPAKPALRRIFLRILSIMDKLPNGEIKMMSFSENVPLRPWKTLARKTILDRGRYLVVESHTVELPDGRVIEDWPWVITPDFVNIVAVTESGQYLCFRQTKYSVEGESLAPFGGYIEPGEDPLQAAQRELQEEAGYQAADWSTLGHFPVDGNRGAGTAHFFLARGAYLIGQTTSDDLEEQHLVLLERAEVELALAAGQFRLLPWAACVLMALQYQDRNRL